MKIKETFLTPDYYNHFCCKCGDCRHTCCQGLTVNITQDEYFKLLGVECTSELRSDLDLSLKVRSNPDPYKYAQICPDFFGKCRMLMDNGWCKLHSECGEKSLSSTCKYFPRSARFNFSPRASTANACERTIELLIDKDKPVEFTRSEMTFDLAARELPSEFSDAKTLDNIQEKLFGMLQEKTAFDKRLENIFSFLTKDSDTDASMYLQANSYFSNIVNILTFAKDQYYAIEEYCENALNILKDYNADSLESFVANTTTSIKKIFPLFDEWIARIFVNDIFFKQFPFDNEKINLSNNALILFYEINILRLLLLTNLKEDSTKDDFVDICAAYFRVEDLTGFNKNILVILHHS